jgi:plastocyanin
MHALYVLLGCVAIMLVAAAGCTTYNPSAPNATLSETPTAPLTTTTPGSPLTLLPTETPTGIPTPSFVPTTAIPTGTPTTSPVSTTIPTVTSPPTPLPPTVTVIIQNFVFVPQYTPISKGSTVTWVNQDVVEHQVINDATQTFGEGQYFLSEPLSQGQSYSFTFTEVGSFPYHDSLHLSMEGTVVVR